MKPAQSQSGSSRNGLGTARLITGVFAVVVILVSWVGLRLPYRGIDVTDIDANGTPLRLYKPSGSASLPGVLVLHGFGSARQVMTGFALALSKAGYAVATLDFGGHGASRRPLDRESGSLQADVDRAYTVFAALPEVDNQRIGILGHSMGSGAAMTAGIRNPERYSAVVAVSPTDAAVTASGPKNLLLLAGTWEQRFLENSRDLLERAGGSTTSMHDFNAGTARLQTSIPNVEHITILFSRISHQAALGWFNSTFGLESGSAYRDGRPMWFGIQLVGWLVLVLSVAPAVRTLTRPAHPTQVKRFERPYLWWITGIISPFVATGLTILVARSGKLGEIGGILVGGTMALWFLVAGMLWLVPGFIVGAPARRDILSGLVLFAVLTAVIGLGAHQVMMNWFLTPARLVRWPVIAVAILPWTLAAGYAQQGRGGWAKTLVFLGQTTVVMVALTVTGLVAPGLYFIVLLLPALPIALGAGAIVGGAADRAWAYGVGNALFLAWMLMAVFPVTRT